MTIFAMPKPFAGHVATIQKNAIRSWTRLDPVPEIILFGDEPGVREMAQEVGARYVPDVGRNEFGTPLVNKLFDAAQEAASHSTVAYVNADMILFQDFMEGVHKVQTHLPQFLLIGQRWDVVVLDEIDFSQADWKLALQREMEANAMLHAECGLDYFVFRKGIYPEIPSFAIGRTAWDNWLVMAPHKCGVPVVDGTEFITAVHQDHDYGHVAGGRSEAWEGVEAERNRVLVGATDNSGRTSGATRILRRDGTLVETAQRTPWSMTIVYRSQRSEWLCQQAARLFSLGQMSLAACKYEEVRKLLDLLLDLKQAGHPHSESLDCADLAQRYTTACMQLAQCYRQMGRSREAVATYTHLLENSRIAIATLQRQEILQVRDELACRLHEQTPVPKVPMADSEQDARPAASPVVSPCASEGETRRVGVPGLKACISKKAGDNGQLNQGLLEAERKYRLMSNGTRAKYAMAVRLADMFRRAGLSEKSLVLEHEAIALKEMCHHHRVTPCTPDRNRAEKTSVMSLDGRPRVTVITSCRNAEKWLPECLDSILNQTLSQWQLVLMDDGSMDGTRRIIETYARRDARIRPYFFDDSAGPYVRRNFAIEQADTPFVCVHDADDIMCPEKLQRLYKAFTEDDRLGVVGSFYRNFLDTFTGLEHTEAPALLTTHEQILEAYQTRMYCDFLSHGCAMIRRALFDEVGLYDENPFGADSFWLGKVAEYIRQTGRFRVRNIPECLTLRRLHSTSQTSMLPAIDPRGRRSYYWRYCVGKLQEVIKRGPYRSEAELTRALRECTCSDFLQRFRTQIVEWESQPLDRRVVPQYLGHAMQLFQQQKYVSCVRILRGLESMEPTTPRCVVNFDLFNAMVFYWLGDWEQAQVYLRREVTHHDNPTARQFYNDCLAKAGQIDVQRWYVEHADAITLGRPEPVPSAPALVTDVALDKTRANDAEVVAVSAGRKAERDRLRAGGVR